MAGYIDEDLYRSWVGLRTLDGYQIEEYIDVGSVNVVYKATFGNSSTLDN